MSKDREFNPSLPKRFILLFCVLSVAVLLLQSDRIGFDPIGFDGGVTALHLAIIQRSTLDHGGVGYGAEVQYANGQMGYFYFNRAPFLYEAVVHFILNPLEQDLAAYIRGARQIQNLVYIATLVISFLLVRLWLGNYSKALFVVLMVGSGYHFLEYKDLVEQNRLSALSAILAIYAIADYEQRRNTKKLLGLVVVSSIIGEASPAPFVFLTWTIVSLIQSIHNRDHWTQWLRRPEPRTLLVSVALTVALIGYSVVMEAQARSVSLTETSIVESAERRLVGADDKYGPLEKHLMAWGNYIPKLGWRILQSFTPHIANTGQISQKIEYFGESILWLIFVFVLFYLVLARPYPFLASPQSIWVTLGYGLIYLIVMRRLIAVHEFTLTSFACYALIGWSFFVGILPRNFDGLLVRLSILIFVINLVSLKVHHDENAAVHNWTTGEFQAIRSALGCCSKTIFIAHKKETPLPYTSFGKYFYFHGHLIVPDRNQAEFIVQTDPEVDKQKSLTPQNTKFFLFRNTTESEIS